jgi:hypothetical protein
MGRDVHPTDNSGLGSSQDGSAQSACSCATQKRECEQRRKATVVKVYAMRHTGRLLGRRYRVRACKAFFMPVWQDRTRSDLSEISVL